MFPLLSLSVALDKRFCVYISVYILAVRIVWGFIHDFKRGLQLSYLLLRRIPLARNKALDYAHIDLHQVSPVRYALRRSHKKETF